jgi:ribose transport system ATP-binding protein
MDAVLQIQNITKQFPGVIALDDVSFDIQRNTVHCLLGENGAGKSTLIKILTGTQSKSSGTILLNGKPVEFRNTREAHEKGISTLFQELNIVDQLTVEENLSLGMERTRFGFFQKDNETLPRMIKTLKRMEPTIDPKQLVSKLSVAKKQIVEIVKAVETQAEIIIMDEPTAAISESEVKRLFAIIGELKKQNVTVIYISHRLDEIFEIGDWVTILRDGRHINTRPVLEVANRSELIQMILGKTVAESYKPRNVVHNEKCIEAKNITNAKLRNLTFDVYKGEIVGVYGLIGSGKTELASALYGIDRYSGELRIRGKTALFTTIFGAVKEGITLAPEERRTEGLFTMLTIRKNIISMNMKKVSRNGVVNNDAARKVSGDYVKKLNIVTDTDDKEVAFLSGGNQQKVVFAKCLNSDANIFLLDEPTRGVDVGAKEEIHNIIRELADEGHTCIVFSSELPEIMSCCDRIFLLYEGELKGILDNSPELSSNQIIHIVAGGEA